MNKREKEYLLYYLDRLSLKRRNNMSEMQQGLNHIVEITCLINNEIPYEPKTAVSAPLSTNTLTAKPLECLIRIKEVSLLVASVVPLFTEW